jgi:hypothetical protein
MKGPLSVTMSWEEGTGDKTVRLSYREAWETEFRVEMPHPVHHFVDMPAVTHHRVEMRSATHSHVTLHK